MEEVSVLNDELSDSLRQFNRRRFSFMEPALDSGKVQDAVDVAGEALGILEHESDVFELFFPGQLIFLRRSRDRFSAMLPGFSVHV